MYYAALIATSVVINKELAGLWISDDAVEWWGVWETEGKEHSLSFPTIYVLQLVIYFVIVCHTMMSTRTMASNVVTEVAALRELTFSLKSFGGLQGALRALCGKFYWNICLHGSVAFNLLLFISFRLIYFFTFAYLLNLITPQIPMQTCCCWGLREAGMEGGRGEQDAGRGEQCGE